MGLWTLWATIVLFVQNPSASKPDSIFNDVIWRSFARAKIQLSQQRASWNLQWQQASGRCYLGTMAARQVCDRGCNSRRHICCVISWQQLPPFQLERCRTRHNPENKQIPAFTKQLHIRATCMRGYGFMEHCQHWISWVFPKNHHDNWWHKWKISPASKNINCSPEVQCSMCSMLFL